MHRRIALALVSLLCFCALVRVYAQPPVVEPALTEAQKLRVQVLAQRMELAQLKAQLAQAEFDRARMEAQVLLASLQVAGYALDPQTLTYSKIPAAVKPPERKEPPK